MDLLDYLEDLDHSTLVPLTRHRSSEPTRVFNWPMTAALVADGDHHGQAAWTTYRNQFLIDVTTGDLIWEGRAS